ncbi:MAG: 2,3-bisphosphoglycerate-dependent phosphoglycerate mutase [Nakamurella sp.]
MGSLVLLRHGQSTYNATGQFTGWLDVPLTELGRQQAINAGRCLAAAGITPDVVHTSLLSRAIGTADLALAEIGRSWIPVQRSWRLNERHYGALTGRVKDVVRAEVGEQQYRIWRNSLLVAPPPMPAELLSTLRHDPRYATLPAELVPATESLGDVVDRLLPYWTDVLIPQLRAGLAVFVVAHGNSLRALVSILDQLDQRDLTALRIPTGEPLHYRLSDSLRPVRRGGERIVAHAS